MYNNLYNKILIIYFCKTNPLLVSHTLIKNVQKLRLHVYHSAHILCLKRIAVVANHDIYYMGQSYDKLQQYDKTMNSFNRMNKFDTSVRLLKSKVICGYMKKSIIYTVLHKWKYMRYVFC